MSVLSRILPAALVATSLGTGATAQSYNGYEAAPYTVERVIGGSELRAYRPHILAEVRVAGPRGAALNRGFQILAGYIFGDNRSRDTVAMTVPVGQAASEKIAMTVPVGQTPDVAGDQVWTISFMMPARWSLETLPVPNTDSIRFREAPGRREAVHVFSGRATERALAEAEAQLRRDIAAAGLRVVGPVSHYYYDDPFTLPWARRNEVALPLG